MYYRHSSEPKNQWTDFLNKYRKVLWKRTDNKLQEDLKDFFKSYLEQEKRLGKYFTSEHMIGSIVSSNKPSKKVYNQYLRKKIFKTYDFSSIYKYKNIKDF